MLIDRPHTSKYNTCTDYIYMKSNIGRWVIRSCHTLLQWPYFLLTGKPRVSGPRVCVSPNQAVPWHLRGPDIPRNAAMVADHERSMSVWRAPCLIWALRGTVRSIVLGVVFYWHMAWRLQLQLRILSIHEVLYIVHKIHRNCFLSCTMLISHWRGV